MTRLFPPAPRRPLSLFLPLIALLVTGCGVDRPAPAAEAPAASEETLTATGFGTGDVWEVGPERTYKKPSEVAGRVGDGDVVLIDAATYVCDTGVVWRADQLTLKGVGGRPHLAAEGCVIPGGKGIWVPGGTDLLIDNIAFSGASVPDENGAGIRFEGAGEVIIRNSAFHHNENGILFTPPFADSTDLLIEHSEFAFNGVSSGQSHNVYINETRSFTFRYNDSHDSHVGHLLKTRARENYILYNRLATMNGTGSYEIDLSEGGDAWIIGNVIQQGRVSENKGVIAYAGEVPVAEGETSSGGHLYVVSNTIVNDRQDGADLVALFDHLPETFEMTNNLFVDIPKQELARMEKAGAALDGNFLTSWPGFADRKRLNYALAEHSEVIGKGVDPGLDHKGDPLMPDRRYRHPAGVEARDAAAGAIDVGALAFRKPVPRAPEVTLEAKSQKIAYGGEAVLRWQAGQASRCQAAGDWSGVLATEGEAVVGPLNHDGGFELICDGEGGTTTASLEVAVAEHPLAASFPDYRFVELSGTRILPLCRDDFPIRGVEGCVGRDLSAAYVPEENAAYFFGGGHRSYFGNEVIRLDLATRDLDVVFGPTDPKVTKNFNPDHTEELDVIADCRGVWDLNDGGTAPAPASVYSGWIYAPSVKKILKLSGLVACGDPWYDDDQWWFDPASNGWELIDRDGPLAEFGSHAVLDPDSGAIIVLDQEDIHRFDPASGDWRTLGPFNDYPWSTTPVLDPVEDVIVIIGDGDYQQRRFTVIDIRGIEAGGLPTQQPWTAKGDLTLLDQVSPGLAYDSRTKIPVGWGGGDKIYLLAIDRATRTIEFIPKTVKSAPKSDLPKRNTFLYAENAGGFLAYTGADRNFFMLKPED